MSRLLLVIDPQNDFISGTLPVPGAADAMDALARYVRAKAGLYVCKIITADRHPYDHCSFVGQGGEWPRHCVHDTVGAAIWPAVFEAVYETSGESHVLHKGERRDREEYSIFRNPEAASEISRLIRAHDITEIDICGLAGDICVRDSREDAVRLYPEIPVRLLAEFSPCVNPR